MEASVAVAGGNNSGRRLGRLAIAHMPRIGVGQVSLSLSLSATYTTHERAAGSSAQLCSCAPTSPSLPPLFSGRRRLNFTLLSALPPFPSLSASSLSLTFKALLRNSTHFLGDGYRVPSILLFSSGARLPLYRAFRLQ